MIISPSVLKIQQAFAKSKSRSNRDGGTNAFIATGIQDKIATAFNGKPLSILLYSNK